MRTNFISRSLARWRLNTIKIRTRQLFVETVDFYRELTAREPDRAYAIYRRGALGGPEVVRISKPDTVSISETDDCVIVKDGRTYEMRIER